MIHSILTLFAALLCLPIIGQELNFTSFNEIEYPLNQFTNSRSNTLVPPVSIKVETFEMSEFITWECYKEFLNDTRKIKGNEVAKQYTPKLTLNLLRRCLNSNEFNQSPVIGVSWVAAREYARWRTIIDNENSIEFTYDLPKRSEWLSALYQLDQKKEKHDLNQNYADWTLASKDESVSEFSVNVRLRVDYQYSALPNDPPAMKRKIAIGASFKLSLPNLTNYNQSYYQDSSYTHIGFRLVKHLKSKKELKQYEDWLSERFMPYVNFNNLNSESKILFGNDEVTYTSQDGRLMGEYSSSYKNDQIKVKGTFYKNQRIGPWIIWDSLGNKILERNYTNSLHFEQIFPKLHDHQAELLRNNRTSSIIRDENNTINYTHIEERAVHWAQRQWIQITKENNPDFFEDDYLYSLLSLAAENDQLTIFSPTTDYFKDTISYKTFLSNQVGRISAFELKEDYFMDLDRGLAEIRPIGISPMTEVIIGNDTTLQSMGWFYFPEVRVILSEAYPQTHVANTEQSLSDTFFLKDYSWKTTHHATIYGKNHIPEDDQSWETRIKQIEQEHNFWIYINSSH